MLDYLASRLSGSGIEFGAGHSPFPVKPGCEVVLADRNTPEELTKRGYFGDYALAVPHLISDLEQMEGIVDASVDFIIASHVIEHTRNPLGALRQAYLKLRPSGQFVLVVPDMTVTFDKNRTLTPLDHLILDDVQPSSERDFNHYVEFFELAFPQENPVQAARNVFELGHDIHFHTWTYESFLQTVEYSRAAISPWSAVWSQPRLTDQDIEFYVVLTK
jgi:hypothetical protein